MTPGTALLFLAAIVGLALLMLAVLVASQRRPRVNRWRREMPEGASAVPPAAVVSRKQGSSLFRGRDSMGAGQCETVAGKSRDFTGMVQCRKH